MGSPTASSGHTLSEIGCHCRLHWVGPSHDAAHEVVEELVIAKCSLQDTGIIKLYHVTALTKLALFHRSRAQCGYWRLTDGD
jgi:hypothetical protein